MPSLLHVIGIYTVLNLNTIEGKTITAKIRYTGPKRFVHVPLVWVPNRLTFKNPWMWGIFKENLGKTLEILSLKTGVVFSMIVKLD